MDKYTVDRIRQGEGFRFVVVYQGHYMFNRKTKEEAELIAERMNKIMKRRIEAMS